MSDPSTHSQARRADAQTPEAKARRGRNIALALGLVLFVVLVFVVTIVRLGANVAQRPF